MKFEISDKYLIGFFFTLTFLVFVYIAFSVNSVHRLIYGKLGKRFRFAEHVVLITGCDSGFGQMMALQYSKMGFFVVACCFNASSAAELKDKVGLALSMDVTKQSAIDSVYKKVDKLLIDRTDLKFYAIINNAGIAPAGCTDWLVLDAFRKAMEVNYFGCIMVIKTFLPFLKRTKGSRIINMSSVAGHVGSYTFGPYSGSKHALEGFAKSLRTELEPWNIWVCNVNPSFMKTPILSNNFELAKAEFLKAPAHIQDQYDISQFQVLIDMIKTVEEDPQMVVNEVSELLTDKSPVFWSFVGKLAFLIRITLLLPRPIQERLSSLSSKGGITPTKEAVKQHQIHSVY